MNGNTFTAVNTRYAVDGQLLTERRVKAGFTRVEFAACCGWSAAYQWKLESGRVNEVRGRTRDVIERVLAEGKINSVNASSNLP